MGCEKGATDVTTPLFAILCSTIALTGEPKAIPLWPGVALGSQNWTQKETEIDQKDSIRRISNVSKPTVTVVLPDPERANGTGIVVCPGGGFRILAIDHEGNDVARWLNSPGVAAFVLKYRVMQTGDAAGKTELAERRKNAQRFAVADGLQAMRIVRSRASEFGLVPQRIGIMGFSAGGYLTAMVALHHEAETRPDFAAPIYPLAPEDLTVPADAGTLFIVQADDDKGLGATRPAFVSAYVNCWTYHELDLIAGVYDARDKDMIFVTPTQLATLYRQAQEPK